MEKQMEFENVVRECSAKQMRKKQRQSIRQKREEIILGGTRLVQNDNHKNVYTWIVCHDAQFLSDDLQIQRPKEIKWAQNDNNCINSNINSKNQTVKKWLYQLSACAS